MNRVKQIFLFAARLSPVLPAGFVGPAQPSPNRTRGHSQWHGGFGADSAPSRTTTLGALSAHAGRCGPSPKRLLRNRAEQRLDVVIGRV